MKQFKSSVVVALFVFLFAACSSCGGGGGGGSGCSSDADCSTYCGFDNAEWRPGAVGSSTNGGFCAGGKCYCCYALGTIDLATGQVTDNHCLACDEVGTNCDADINYSCYAVEDVCLLNY